MKKEIKTIKELDEYIKQHPMKNPELNQFGDPHPHAGEIYYMSRYDALVLIYGENKADAILHELSIIQCF